MRDISGMKSARLTVLKFSHIDKKRNKVWDCECICGKIIKVEASKIIYGLRKSCGCSRNVFTGVTKSFRDENKKEYKCFHQMRQRILNKKHKQYSSYGGRGISICERWSLFKNFFDDMGKAPSKKHSIERKDVNGNYEPSNCKWATTQEQNCNKRNNIRINFRGEQMVLSEFANKVGIKYAAVYSTVRKKGIEFAAKKYGFLTL